MSAIADKLLQELLQLSPEERDDIVQRVYESEDESNYDPEYAEELRRRLDDHVQGRTRPIPFDEALEMIEAEGADDTAA